MLLQVRQNSPNPCQSSGVEKDNKSHFFSPQCTCQRKDPDSNLDPKDTQVSATTLDMQLPIKIYLCVIQSVEKQNAYRYRVRSAIPLPSP